MRTFLKLLVLSIFITISAEIVRSEEPGNNLNKSLRQILREFPDCIFWCDAGGSKYYKSSGDDFPIMFEIKNDKVISEFMNVEGDNFAREWFTAIVNSFSRSDYIHVLPSDGNSYHFVYSYFTVHISYDDFQKKASITYELLPKYIK